MVENADGKIGGLHIMITPWLECKLLSAEIVFHTSFDILMGHSKTPGPNMQSLNGNAIYYFFIFKMDSCNAQVYLNSNLF